MENTNVNNGAENIIQKFFVRRPPCSKRLYQKFGKFIFIFLAFTFSLFIIFLFCGASNAAGNFESKKLADLNSAFRRQCGFLGGDGFYNIPFSEYKSLVIFGDTLTGTISGGRRELTGMPHNSAAMFYHSPGPDGTIRYGAQFFLEPPLCPLLENEDKNKYFWPLDGFLSNGKLYCFAAQIEVTKANDAFGFKECGNYIFKIDNPELPVKMWNKKNYKVEPAKFGKNSYLIWGSSVVKHEGYIYIYGVYSFKSSKSLVMARVEEPAFENYNAWEFYSNGRFVKNKMPSPLFDGISNEFSVIFDQVSGKFRIVYTLNSMGPYIVMRTSDTPVFTVNNPAEIIYSCPENGITKNIFTYSAKAVKALCNEKRLVVVYFTNSADVADPINNPDIYWPEFVEIKL
jgi:hypothetical protein